MEPEADACWLVQVSEILLTEVTWKEPSLAWVPCTWTFWPSYGLIEDWSPVRFTVWPLSEVNTQLPPDCLRHPVIEFCDELEVVLVVLVVVLWLLGVVVLGVVVLGVVLCVSLGVVVLGEVVLGVVLCVLLGLVLWLGFCWASFAAPVAVEPVGLAALPPGPVEPAAPPLPPACANAMPEASIIAKINFLFMSVAPSKFHCPWVVEAPALPCANQSVI
jgi:hypothetical protein